MSCALSLPLSSRRVSETSHKTDNDRHDGAKYARVSSIKHLVLSLTLTSGLAPALAPILPRPPHVVPPHAPCPFTKNETVVENVLTRN